MTAAFARRSPAAVALALATVCLVWGSTYLAIRVSNRTLPPLLMTSVRFLLAGALLYVASVGRGPHPSWREWRAATVVGALLLVIGSGGVAWAETRINSGLAALIVAMMPLWIALLDRIVLGRRLSALGVLGLTIGFGGVALLVAPGSGVDLVGGLVLVACTLSWACGSLYARGASLPSRPLVSAAMQMITGGLLLGIVGVAFGEVGRVHLARVSTASLLAFAYLVLVGSVLAFSAYAWLLRNARTTLVSTYAYVNPIVAVALGAAFLGEPIGLTTLVAGAAIVIAVVLIVGARPRGAQPASASTKTPRAEAPAPVRAAA